MLHPRVRSRSTSASLLLLTMVLISGCFGGTEPGVRVGEHASTIDPAEVVAIGAIVRALDAQTVEAVWEGPITVDGGFRITLPRNTTYVEAERHMHNPGATAYLRMENAETGRIRCQPETYQAYFVRTQGIARCSGLAVLEPTPAIWRTNDLRVPTHDALGNRVNDGVDLLEGERLVVRLSAAPLDGEAAKIDLDALSQPRHGILPTEHVIVPASADQAPLWVEVTRPDVEGPVPTIIISSPYTHAVRAAGERPYNSTIADWVPRGYAIVVADVRGFGESGGCVEVWGPNEQSDQVDLVAYVAAQAWSDGMIGFYGQSYVGTTPLEAAVLGAEALDAIIIVAPVVNAYEDWHFGGVPNGENIMSPVAAYQVLGTEATFRDDDPYTSAHNIANGFCDPTLGARANDPRAVYDAFYEERDLKRHAHRITAATLYTQGFYDTNVKSAMIPGFFNAIEAPKKGLFGDWVHQHPARGDQELYFHAWFDEHLKGIDTGIMGTPVVEVKTNLDTVRHDTHWPAPGLAPTAFPLRADGHAIIHGDDGDGRGELSYVSTPSHDTAVTPPLETIAPERVVLSSEPWPEGLHISGEPAMRIDATIENAENHFFYAELRDVAPDGHRDVITYGMLNAALRDDRTTYAPLTPGQRIQGDLPFLPTEHIVAPGHRLELVLRSADVDDWSLVNPTQPGLVRLHLDGAAGTALMLPLLDVVHEPAPRSAGPVDPARLARLGLSTG